MVAPPPDELPEHIRAIVETIGVARARHERAGGWLRRAEQRLIQWLALPQLQVLVLAATVAWLAYNAWAVRTPLPLLDPPPFNYAANLATLIALLATLMILATQRHENELSERRAELLLQLAILAEQRSAKLMQMVDDLRRDLPSVEHRFDPETQALAEPADPLVVLDALRAIDVAGPEDEA